MDTRKLLTYVLMFIAIFFAVQYFTSKRNAPAPVVQPAAAFTQAASQPLAAEDGAVPTTLRLGDPGKTSKDKVAITLNNVTADIDLVQLNINDYAEDVQHTKPLTLLQDTPGVPKPFSTLSVDVDDGKAYHFDLYAAQYVWKIEEHTPYRAVLLATMTDDAGKPMVEVRKIFTVDPATYDVQIQENVQNKTGHVLTVHVDSMAATDLPKGILPIDDRFYIAGSLDSTNKVVKTDRLMLYHADLVKQATPTKVIGQFNNFADNPFLWIASSNRFFSAITRPEAQPGTPPFVLAGGQAIPQPQYVASAEIDELRSAPDTTENIYGVKMIGSPLSIPAGATTSMPFSVFFGPKDRNILQGHATAPVGSIPYNYSVFDYVKVIQFSRGGCYSYCTFDWLATFLLAMLDLIAKYVTFHNYGLAIFLLVILVRAILHPLTKSSQINMATMGKKMNAIKPQIETIKKKYAGDKKREQEETMRIYRENNVNPAGGIMGCLPMLIQMPIWVAMYQGLWNDLDLRHAVFIPGWINDLAAPDALFTFAPIQIPFVGWHVSSFNLLPILLGVVFFFQMKIQTATQPKPADEQQAQVQKYSQFMFLLFPIFLYNAPAGLNLYYFASTAAGLVDTYIVRKTLKKRGILPASAETLPTHQQG